MVKCVQKTYTIARKLSAEITGHLYDLRELKTSDSKKNSPIKG